MCCWIGSMFVICIANCHKCYQKVKCKSKQIVGFNALNIMIVSIRDTNRCYGLIDTMETIENTMINWRANKRMDKERKSKHPRKIGNILKIGFDWAVGIFALSIVADTHFHIASIGNLEYIHFLTSAQKWFNVINTTFWILCHYLLNFVNAATFVYRAMLHIDWSAMIALIGTMAQFDFVRLRPHLSKCTFVLWSLEFIIDWNILLCSVRMALKYRLFGKPPIHVMTSNPYAIQSRCSYRCSSHSCHMCMRRAWTEFCPIISNKRYLRYRNEHESIELVRNCKICGPSRRFLSLFELCH